MSIKTSNTNFQRIRQQIEDPIMRKAVANAQQRIGANRQKMVDELGHWEEWRNAAAQIRDHVLSNLDAYLYQLYKVTQNGGHVYFAEKPKKRYSLHFTGCPTQKCPEGGEI